MLKVLVTFYFPRRDECAWLCLWRRGSGSDKSQGSCDTLNVVVVVVVVVVPKHAFYWDS